MLITTLKEVRESAQERCVKPLDMDLDFGFEVSVHLKRLTPCLKAFAIIGYSKHYMMLNLNQTTHHPFPFIVVDLNFLVMGSGWASQGIDLQGLYRT